jgi:hypothetical protein
MIGRREFVYDMFEPASDIAVRAYGEVVAVRYRARIEVHWNGGNDRGLFWHTDIYERRNGRWQALVSGDADRGAGLASGGVRSHARVQGSQHEFLRPANRDPPPSPSETRNHIYAATRANYLIIGFEVARPKANGPADSGPAGPARLIVSEYPL